MKKAIGIAFLAFVGVLFLTGCSRGLTSGLATLSLTQTYELPDFGFSIDYPEGWEAATRGSVTGIFENEDDRRWIGVGCCNRSSGVMVVFDHRKISLLESWGLPSEASLDDLVQFNVNEISGMSNPELLETTIFGVPAMRTKFYEVQYYLKYAGFIADEAFIIGPEAPTKEMLEAFLPTWDLMLESIQPTG